MLELSLEQACAHAADFMYLWADEQKFLRYIKPQYANVIRIKQANQHKLLLRSIERNGGTYEEWTDKIREAFIEQWGMTPVTALVTLADGGQVAGKNWKEGVYGVGTLPTSTFKGVSVGTDGKGKVTVDTKTGHILRNGVDITDESRTVVDTIKNKTIPYILFATDDLGVTYQSKYNKTLKKYYADCYQLDGVTYNAYTGKQQGASDSSDIWGAIMLNLEQFINWIISLFGGSSANKETISAANTLPNQKADGFVSEAGLGDTGLILLAAAAGGWLIFGSKGKKQKGVKGCR